MDRSLLIFVQLELVNKVYILFAD